MTLSKKPSVLVCVTGQYDCDRLITAGFEKAVELSYDLHVLCVHTPVSNAAFISDEIEYLYQTAKNLYADMTIAFNNNAPQTAVDFAKKINAKVIVTGMPDDRPIGFVDTVHELLPKTQITMVTKTGEWLTYSSEFMVRASA
ncbi:MAG: hypothetical protein IKB73_02260 [Ruminococcus sp.]|nr:hypothetical protein [Ruminococcus sp.]